MISRVMRVVQGYSCETKLWCTVTLRSYSMFHIFMSIFTIGCEGSVNKDQDRRSQGEDFVHSVPQKGNMII